MEKQEQKKKQVRPPSGRGGSRSRGPSRGRGSFRGRARGRGRGQRVNKQLPTVEQRIAQIRAVDTREPSVPVPNAPSTDKLSSLMDSLYPTSSDVARPYSNVNIDVYGFCNIVEKTYITIAECDSKAEKLLSYDEFSLVMGWLLARRVLAVRNTVYQSINPGEDLFSGVPITTPVPGPIASCLESLGHVRSPSGIVMVPQMMLPKIDVKSNWQRGLFPSHQNQQFLGDADDRGFSVMYPYWYYKRKIQFEWGNLFKYDEDCLEKLDPNNKYNEGVDGVLKRHQWIPGIRNVGRTAVSERVEQQPPLFCVDSSILGSICYSGTILGSYLSFMKKAEKIMVCRPIKSDTSGTGCMLGWVQHYTNSLSVPTYKCYSSYNLNASDMHGVRIFKWRRRYSKFEDVLAGASVDFYWNMDPTELKNITREIDYIRNDIVMLHDFVHAFVIDK